MQLQRVEFRNVGSYGDQLHTLDFTARTAGLYLVVGKNGHGKSTLAEVLKLALYGRAGDGRRLRDLANRINKRAWVRLQLRLGADQVVIERGVDPSFLTLTVNGQEYEQAGRKQVQEFLETEVLRLPFNLFNNLVSLSINDFKSFLHLKAADKREILDRVLGLDVLNVAREQVRGELRAQRAERDQLAQLRTQQEQYLHQLRAQLTAHQTERREQVATQLTQLATRKGELHAELSTLAPQHTQQAQRLQDLSVQVQQAQPPCYAAQHAVADLQRQLKLYDQDRCPTCGGDLRAGDHQAHHQQLHQQLVARQQELQQAQQHLAGLQQAHRELQVPHQQLTAQLERLRVEAEQLLRDERQLLAERDRPADDQGDRLAELVQTAERTWVGQGEKLTRLDRQVAYQQLLEQTVGEQGFRQDYVRGILAPLNAQINRYLTELDLPFSVELNEELDARVLLYGEELDASTLSTGEHKRVDFAVLLGVIHLLRLRLPDLNLLFLDEVFSSLDEQARQDVVRLLREVVDELQLNVLVINHAELPLDQFDYQLQVLKEHGFSRFELTNLHNGS